MSTDLAPEASPPVRSLADLVAWFREGERPRERWQVGLEHEKVAVLSESGEPVPYEGARAIGELLSRLRRFGYRPLLERDHLVAAARSGQLVSLEPGGQVELSGVPHRDPVEAARENARHLARLRAIGAELGIALLGIGYRPTGAPAGSPWMPRRRYELMREYLPQQGRRALDMMLMTASVQ